MGTVKNASGGLGLAGNLLCPFPWLCLILFDFAGHPERRSTGAPEPSSLALVRSLKPKAACLYYEPGVHGSQMGNDWPEQRC
jgi:hypothetical protein